MTAPQLRAQQDTLLGTTVVRFYRAGGPETLVEVFCRIPLAVVEPLAGLARDGAYRIAVSVRDSTGLELLSSAWSQTVAGKLLRVGGASSAEHVQFVARPGRYTIDVVVADSASGRLRRQRTEVAAYSQRPRASDLLVAGAARRAAAGDTTPRSGEIRKGALFLETSGRPVATPERAQLGYYLELYAQRPETAAVAAQVLDLAGKQYAATEAQRIALPAGGGAATAMLDLSGLPPGDYRLRLIVDTPDSQVVREAGFGMTGFAPPAGVAAPPGPEAAGADSLAGLPEVKLDSMYAPLVYLISPDERGVYRGLTPDGKRTFLRQFWKRRDPTPGTARNEVEEEFYRIVGEADRQFREKGGATVPGWRTDRGRIYIRFGPPDDVLNESQPRMRTRPYLVWKYTKGKLLKFVFLDSTSLGTYELIWTNERSEPTRPGWQQELGPAAVEDVQRF